ncbi:hypothetical protein [Chthonomonas calidirosea]|uniref:hypothetical protein n=1 Tax=Chthonomonas calidirosea TaxID=454171 RepID=UPI0012DC206D|nr:hypothetical protein [Chthonomonas calidirosea]
MPKSAAFAFFLPIEVRVWHNAMLFYRSLPLFGKSASCIRWSLDGGHPVAEGQSACCQQVSSGTTCCRATRH